MKLHDITAMLDLDNEDEDEEHDYSVCQNCGAHQFEQTLYGSYTELHTYDTSRDYEEWHNHNGNMDDADQWSCMRCGLPVDDEVADYINNRI